MEQPVSIYDKLLELPLFQGHSREDLTSILSKIKVDFRNFRKGQVLAAQDDPCQNFIFLMDGEVTLQRISPNKSLTFTEQFAAPNAFGIETTFGMRQNFSHTITAATDVRTLVVSKHNIINYLFSYEVFRYNMLNYLTTRIQRSNQLLWTPESDNITKNFIRLCKCNFTYLGGQKQIEGGMVSLAGMMDETRIHVSNMLNELEKRGLVKLTRKRIIIPQLQQLIQEA